MNCNGMKTSALIAAAVACTPLASADTLWSTGVSREQGWYDFNKTRDGSQSEMCWAICAANLVAWWQNAQPEGSLPAQVPMGDAVWSTFRESFTNNGSDPDEGMRWWFSGKYEPQTPASGDPCASITQEATGHYYTEVCEAADEFLWNLLRRGRGAEVNAESLNRAFYEGFNHGDAFWIGVAYYRPNGSRYTHSLTVWGADYDYNAAGEPRIVAIYMTDSDDGCRYLHRIPVKVVNNAMLFDCPEHPLYAAIGHIEITTITRLMVGNSGKQGN